MNVIKAITDYLDRDRGPTNQAEKAIIALPGDNPGGPTSPTYEGANSNGHVPRAAEPLSPAALRELRPKVVRQEPDQLAGVPYPTPSTLKAILAESGAKIIAKDERKAIEAEDEAWMKLADFLDKSARSADRYHEHNAALLDRIAK